MGGSMRDADNEALLLGPRKEGPFWVDEGREAAVHAGEFGAFVGWIDVAWDGPGAASGGAS